MRQLHFMLVFTIAGGLLIAPSAIAQQRTATKEKPTATATGRQPDKSKVTGVSGMTKAREAAALAFVREHHAELEALLIQLKESQPKQYEQAVRDLFRTSERLAVWQEKDPQRHEVELNAWQARSRVQLLSATLLMTPQDKSTAEKLKQALLEENKVRRKILLLDHERTSRRLERIEAQIESLEKNADKAVDRHIKQLIDGTTAVPAKAPARNVD